MPQKTKSILAADLFCGAGGTTTGAMRAAEKLGRTLKVLAVNHWQIAIDTHAQNHPSARHLCVELDGVDPAKEVPGRRLHILFASPECTHHSRARGGKPRSDQSRASAWLVLKWLQELYVENVVIENVPEFAEWGPLTADGHVMKQRRGEIFQAFIAALRAMNYTVEWRVLCCADYGDATTRKRLFILARRGKQAIHWPEPTHSKTGKPTLFNSNVRRWRPTREIIDWTVQSRSIFDRSRPLSPNTLRRIFVGLERFSGLSFVTSIGHTQDGGGRIRSLDRPMPTLTTKAEYALVEPFVLPNEGVHRGNAPRSTDKPLPTITQRGGGQLVEPFILNLRGGADKYTRGQTIDEPMQTITAQPAHALVEPFVIGQQSKAAPRSTDEPLPTIAGAGAIQLAEPFIVKYYRTGGAVSVDEPLPTIATKDKFGLVLPVIVDKNTGAKGIPIVLADGTPALLDIRLRMFKPHELAAAHGFGSNYHFVGTQKDVMKQIGNSVPTATAEALTLAMLAD